MYAKVSKKGQVTIPIAIREKLEIVNEGAVLFLVEDNEVKLKGIPGAHADQLGGSLKKHAKEYVPLNKIRKKIKVKIADIVDCILAAHSSSEKVVVSFDKDLKKLKAVIETL
jgi:AbrB family looped-hinge helix DNA binding protein